MAETVAKLGVKRDNNFMYFISKGDVWRVPRKKPGQPKGKKESVAKAGIDMDYSQYVYFLDGNGDIARAKRRVGGTAKAKKTTKAAPKKAAAKKAAPKKAVAKKKPAAKKAAPKKKPAKKK
jgi:hypothetical protein